MSSKTLKQLPPKLLDPLIEGFRTGLQIPYEDTVTDWISEFVVMPHSARSKKHDRTVSPQWNAIFDAFADDSKRCITVLAPPGGGKTGALECLLSYIVKEAPGPTGIASQTNETTEFWAKTRLIEVFKATPPVFELFPANPNSIKKDEILFPHMPINLGGANMTNFQEKSLQYAFGDEVWRWGHGLIKEYEARLHDRWNGKIMLFSQGGWTDTELEDRFLKGDQQYWGYTCPSCNQWYRFTWSLIHYEKKFKDDGNVDWPATEASASLRCACGKHEWQDTTSARREVCNLGSYRAHNPDHVREWSSFQFSAFGVWQIPWGRMVREWLVAQKAKEAHDLELLKVFIQKRCVEFADAQVIETLESEPLFTRREQYDIVHVPNFVLSTSGGCDVQDDRLEAFTIGWGVGQESWCLDYKIFLGDPTSPEVWEELENFRMQTYLRQDGTRLHLAALGVDTGRHPNDVYAYCKPRLSEKVFALKGSSESNMPIVSRPKKSGVEKARLFMVGTDTAKTRIYSRLQIKPHERGSTPGYIHFPHTDPFDEVYFKQLTSEKVITKISRGQRIKAFEKHGRNEALDCMVYAMAAMQILNPNFEKLAMKLVAAKSEQSKPVESTEEPDEPTTTSSEQDQMPPRRSRRRRGFGRGGWIGGGR